jgi:hypothetical protein
MAFLDKWFHCFPWVVGEVGVVGFSGHCSRGINSFGWRVCGVEWAPSGGQGRIHVGAVIINQ